MTSVEEIEEAVAALPPDKLARFRTRFEEFESARFDRQIERDVRSGRLDELAAQLRALSKRRRQTPSEKLLRETRKSR
jgi:hypothetical protein